MQNSRWRQDADQSGYYSKESNFDSVSVTLVTTSEASTARKEWNREQEGTFDCRLNQKITLLKLNATPVLMTFGYGWPGVDPGGTWGPRPPDHQNGGPSTKILQN